MENVVSRIVIEKLYDIYDYDIPFSKGGLTVITGPNGYGKTTLLNIIMNAHKLNFWYFYELPYQSILIYWGDGTILSFKREKVQKKSSQTDLSIELSDEDVEFTVKVEYFGSEGQPIDIVSLTAHRFRYLMDRGRSWYHRVTESGPEIDPWEDTSIMLSKEDGEIQKNFRNLRIFADGHNCLFVKDQRVYRTDVLRRREFEDSGKKDVVYTITSLARKIQEMYVNEMKNYAVKSQQIDSTFIQRQIQNDTHKKYSPEEYREKIKNLKDKIANFRQYGLIEKYDIVENYDKEELQIPLSMHVDDMKDKYGEYDEFYDKLVAFDRCVNGKGLSHKKMILDPRQGMIFMDDINHVIPLQKLSSGEQNMVILFYRLVFETNSDTLLLVDEPENSIHTEWLKKMLDDYMEMVRIKKCQMIIATHSVTFINGHWDKAYDLYGGSYQDWMESLNQA